MDLVERFNNAFDKVSGEVVLLSNNALHKEKYKYIFLLVGICINSQVGDYLNYLKQSPT